MFLIPHHTYQLSTALSPRAAAARLRGQVGSPYRGQQRSEKPFFGTVTFPSFQISRSISGRNSFLPVLRGTIAKSEQGAVLTVHADFSRYTQIFFWIWMAGAAGIGVLPGVVSLFTEHNPAALLMGFAFAAAGWLVSKLLFSREDARARHMLIDLLRD
ncbi:MAG: hypothetical protein PHS97_06785 [Oscillospiraceae bacterium]|nr:hypothetical protein [Oscillospiraceae bacterium]